MLYTINARAFSAVVSAQGVEDARYYLNGFCVDMTAMKLVAANGHVLTESPLEGPDAADAGIPDKFRRGAGDKARMQAIFGGVSKPLPKSAERVAIDVGRQRLEVTGAKYKGPRYIALEEIDGTYPDYSGVSVAGAPTAEDGPGVFGVNSEYLHRALKWAGVSPAIAKVAFTGGDSMNPVKVTYRAAELRDVTTTVMLVRT